MFQKVYLLVVSLRIIAVSRGQNVVGRRDKVEETRELD